MIRVLPTGQVFSAGTPLLTMVISMSKNCILSFSVTALLFNPYQLSSLMNCFFFFFAIKFCLINCFKTSFLFFLCYL